MFKCIRKIELVIPLPSSIINVGINILFTQVAMSRTTCKLQWLVLS